MTDTITDRTEVEDLESGLVSGFWKWLQAQVLKEWGPEGYANRVSKVVQEPDQQLVVDKLRQLAVLRDQARWFLSLPQERLDVLNGKADSESPSIAEKVMALQAQDRRTRGPRRGHL